MKLGILGGTFDPIHLGHLEAASAARRALSLDDVLLMPARMPPHRASEPHASPFHRFAMAALAAAGDGFSVSDLELRRDGPSYTALTLEALHRDGLLPGELYFITGSDAFAEVGTWYDYPRILSLANFVVVSRPGAPHAAAVIPAHAASSAGPATAILTVEAATPDVSSTDIRRRLRSGEHIDGLVPPAVAAHIQRHRLYTPVRVAAIP